MAGRQRKLDMTSGALPCTIGYGRNRGLSLAGWMPTQAD